MHAIGSRWPQTHRQILHEDLYRVKPRPYNKGSVKVFVEVYKPSSASVFWHHIWMKVDILSIPREQTWVKVNKEVVILSWMVEDRLYTSLVSVYVATV